MHPPGPIIITPLHSESVRLEPEVFKTGTVLLLVQPGRGGVETGPGVEDDGTRLLAGDG